jgi:peptidoglycan/LPS O-acetylase OafA/YrhL
MYFIRFLLLGMVAYETNGMRRNRQLTRHDQDKFSFSGHPASIDQPPPDKHPGLRRSPGLDGLRGIAALSVLLFHLWLYARVDPGAATAPSAAAYAWSDLRWGLLLFFVLSGFLLYRPWIAMIGTTERPDLMRYFRSRAARVLPAYYLALAGSCLLLWHAGGVPGVRLPSHDSLGLFLVFGQNFSGASLLTLDPPMWTLAVEVSFYLALPLLGTAAIRLGRRHQTWMPIALIVLGIAWGWVVNVPDGPLTKVLPAMLPFFGLGMLAATLAHGRTLRRTGVAGLVALAVGGLLAQLAAQIYAPTLSLSLHDLPIAVAFAAIVVLAASPRSPRPLSWKPLDRLGTISYGIYLWHVPVIWWLRARGLLPLEPVAALPVVLAPTLLIATMSWFLVERPMMAWARRAARPQETPRVRRLRQARSTA